MPGQVGLNAGIMPNPGFTYANISINYRSGAFNNANGSAIPVTGNYDVWAVENLFYGVVHAGPLHGDIDFALILTPATGSLAADLATQNPGIPNLSAVGGRGRWNGRYLSSALWNRLAPEAGGHPDRPIGFCFRQGDILPAPRITSEPDISAITWWTE